jgi:hypothetical protein
MSSRFARARRWPRPYSELVARRGLASALVLLSFLALVAPAPALAQAPPVDQDVVRQLIERIEELERQVGRLRDGAAGSKMDATTVPASASAAAPVVVPAVLRDAPWPGEHGAHASQAPESDDVTNPEARISPLAEIHWFGDVGFRATDQPGETTSFSLGQLDLFLTSSLADRLNILSELVFRAGTDNRYVVNAERLLLQYTPSPYLSLAVGRYHTAIGFYNTAYHHGSWFETAVTRPTIFAYRGGLIPIHDVGVMASGRVPSGRLGLGYVFELGNGQSSQSASAEATQNAIDENDGKAVNIGFFAKPDFVPGLQAGFSAHVDRLHPATAPRATQTTYAAHAIYQSQTFEWLNEAVAVRSARSAPATDTTTTGFYTQVSRQLGTVRPYFRYQLVDAHDLDLAFRALGHRHGPTLGARYDLGKFAAVKAQYERTARRGLPAVNGFASQLAFTF